VIRLDGCVGALQTRPLFGVSTLAYNDHNETDGAFQYYKDATGLYDFDIVDVEHGPEGGADNFYANGCGCPGNCSYTEGDAGILGHMLGTELDWLRAYWDFRTNASPGSEPTHWQIFDHVADVYHAYPNDHYSLIATQGRLEAYIPAALADRWDEAMDYNGADNTPE
jgi:hypothetical protein